MKFLIALVGVLSCSNAVDGKNSENGGSTSAHSSGGSVNGGSAVGGGGNGNGSGQGGVATSAGTASGGASAGSAGTSASGGSGGTGGSTGNVDQAGSAGQPGTEATCSEPAPECTSGGPDLMVTCCGYCDCVLSTCPDAFASHEACITACKSYREDQLCCAQSYCIAAMTGPHCDHAVIPSGACPQ